MEVLGWHGYMWFAVVRPVGHTTKFSKMTLDAAYGREMNIQFSGNISASQLYSLSQNLRLVLCCVTKLAFYCPQHKVYLCNDHAV